MTNTQKRKYSVIQPAAAEDWVETIDFLPYKLELYNKNYATAIASQVASGVWLGVDYINKTVELGTNIPVSEIIYSRDFLADVADGATITTARALLTDVVTIEDVSNDSYNKLTVTAITTDTNAVVTVEDLQNIEVGDELIITGSRVTPAPAIKYPPAFDGKYIVSSFVGNVITTTRDTSASGVFEAGSALLYVSKRIKEGVLRPYDYTTKALFTGKYKLTIASSVFANAASYVIYVYPSDQ